MIRGVIATVAAVALFAIALMAVQSGAFNGPRSPSPSPTDSSPPPSSTPATSSARPTPDVTASPQTTATPAPPATPTPAPTPVDTSVAASAVVVPVRSAELATRVSGVVDSIYVRDGSQALANQLLLRLDQSSYLDAIDLAAADVTTATQAVARAQLVVDQLPPDASPAAVELAQANLRLAQAELESARAALAEAQGALLLTEVRAPFAGTVAAVTVEVGEHAQAGQAVITLGDLSGWLIETTDLSELEIVPVAVGDRAAVTFEALPGVTLGGTVDSIEVRGTTPSGLFAVSVRLDSHEPRLRWGMTATVRIFPSG